MSILNYFKPVSTWTADKVREYLAGKGPEEFTLLDVRQPREYEVEHLPGATLMPVGDIPSKLGTLDPNKTTITYCAAGVRSRAAAAVLKDAGFRDVISMEGGINAWQGMVATGVPESGMAYFSPADRPEDLIALAWALEEGSRRFYQEMGGRLKDPDAAALLTGLARAEEHHKASLVRLYKEFKGDSATPEAVFASPSDIMEGGISVDEAIEWAGGRETAEVLEFVMGLETNAYDLYIKMGRAVGDEASRKIFAVLSAEEQAHLARIGDLLERKV